MLIHNIYLLQIVWFIRFPALRIHFLIAIAAWSQLMYLSERMRGDLRMFAFFLGNLSLLPEDHDGHVVDYSVFFATPSPLLGHITAAYIHTYMSGSRDETYDRALEGAAHCLLTHGGSAAALPAGCTDAETLVQSHDPDEVRCIIHFAWSLGMKKLEPDLLGDVPYHAVLMEYGSFLEMVFAIYSNVLSTVHGDTTTRDSTARRRSAQYIRRYMDRSFQVEPPFEVWETVLW